MRRFALSILLVSGVLVSAQVKKKNYKKVKSTKSILQKKAVSQDSKKDTLIVQPVSESLTVKTVEEIKEDKDQAYMNAVKKLEKNRGWISNRNSYGSRGVWVFLKGVWSGHNKIFIMAELQNSTNINYDIETITFLGQPVSKDHKDLQNDDKPYIPIWQTDFQSLAKKSKQKMIFVFDKFTISEKSVLMMTVDEHDGERSIKVPIYSKYINGAEYIN
ncbi:DUF4138 domain-containing protein (plasmid) [Elizabethkingia anophelis]|uniref:DUF4138 domain-containing protein n=1 Tax=Elizabethkingia anophelis TaxID=1117645 RepID=UPI0020B6CB57|nr:DUF4138 domain-containing protein [Elizabethkingia anophelis]UTG66824.1 DUF4138 domain-containing protein [Elizabethkingia anophelis]